MIKASIIGATGYAGAELARLLANHPEVEISYLASKSYEGQIFGELYSGHACEEYQLSAIDIDKICASSDVVFTALPHGVSSDTVSELNKYDVKIIDLSGDFRYDNLELYEKWYGVSHSAPDLMKSAVYGLSELYKEEIKNAKVIGNPGCYTTCGILTLYPLLENNLIDESTIIYDAKSGVSGAGRSPSNALHFCEVDGSFKAYKIANHRHTSEIEEKISQAANKNVAISFTPHLIPIKRGILGTFYATLKDGVSAEDIQKTYEKKYGNEPFVKLWGENKIPELKHVVGSNSFITGFVVDKRVNRLIVVSVIDNLIKGAAGQAVQNMNIMFNLDEKTGLNIDSWYL
ncbi:MAG: N-acetyl-gamma-glutamyl-phosphate reductase [Eubacteriales bacterium]